MRADTSIRPYNVHADSPPVGANRQIRPQKNNPCNRRNLRLNELSPGKRRPFSPQNVMNFIYFSKALTIINAFFF